MEMAESRMKSWGRRRGRIAEAGGDQSTDSGLIGLGGGLWNQLGAGNGFGSVLLDSHRVATEIKSRQELGGFLQINEGNPVVHALLQNHGGCGDGAGLIQRFQLGAI